MEQFTKNQIKNVSSKLQSQIIKIDRITSSLKLSLDSNPQFLAEEQYLKTLLNMNNAMADFISAITKA